VVKIERSQFLEKESIPKERVEPDLLADVIAKLLKRYADIIRRGYFRNCDFYLSMTSDNSHTLRNDWIERSGSAGRHYTIVKHQVEQTQSTVGAFDMANRLWKFFDQPRRSSFWEESWQLKMFDKFAERGQVIATASAEASSIAVPSYPGVKHLLGIWKVEFKQGFLGHCGIPEPTDITRTKPVDTNPLPSISFKGARSRGDVSVFINT
jgi:hypothetical protein